MALILVISWACISSTLLIVAIYHIEKNKSDKQKIDGELAILQKYTNSLISCHTELKENVWNTTPIIQKILVLLEQGETMFIRQAQPLRIDEQEAFVAACNAHTDGKMTKLLIEYPLMSFADLVLCCCMHMRLSTPCISVLLSKELETVYKNKYRIKKKMNLGKSKKSLDEILAQTW